MKRELTESLRVPAVEDRLATVPTRLLAVHPAFRNTNVPVAKQVEKLGLHATTEVVPVPRKRGHQPADTPLRKIRVELFQPRVPQSFARGDGTGRRVAIAELPCNAACDEVEGVEAACLEVLAKLDTDALLTLHAMISLAVENGGHVVDNLPALARRRGWKPSSLDVRSRPGAATRRERLRDHLHLLSRIEFVVTALSDGTERYVAFPLLRALVRVGECVDGRRVREHVVYEFHPLLWRDMMQDGRALFYDRAALTANAKKDEWAVRLLWYMDSRWGRGWVSKRLDQNGGRLTERLGVLVTGAGLEYQRQLRAQGRPWLRRTFRKALDRLQRWSPDPLIGGFEIAEHPADPLEDRVTFWPTCMRGFGDTCRNSRRCSTMSRPAARFPVTCRPDATRSRRARNASRCRSSRT